jgi:hypothetical protein
MDDVKMTQKDFHGPAFVTLSNLGRIEFSDYHAGQIERPRLCGCAAHDVVVAATAAGTQNVNDYV